MSHPRVTVIVVSRHRPRDLDLCLKALRQLFFRNFEIVVVCDRASASVVDPEPGIRTVVFEEENISKARNIGAAHSAGDILAFIDDDAVAEPTWLSHLIPPFDDDRVGASGGFVIGRNGFSVQWAALSVDTAGWTHPIRLDGSSVEKMLWDGGQRAIRTQGTNMAVRRSVLAELGGFDPAFVFYHDESDLNMRIAKAGWLTALVPKARVNHKSSSSSRRKPNRVPKSLLDVGASSAVFHRKYLSPGDWAQAREDLINSERRRLEYMLIDGRTEPKMFETLIKSLHDGYTEGLERVSGEPQKIGESTEVFEPISNTPETHEIIVSRFLPRRAARKRAKAIAASGAVVSLIILDPTARFHRVRFTQDGYWEQMGGIFGRSVRTHPIVQFSTFRSRSEAEVQRCSQFRNPNATM